MLDAPPCSPWSLTPTEFPGMPRVTLKREGATVKPWLSSSGTRCRSVQWACHGSGVAGPQLGWDLYRDIGDQACHMSRTHG